MRSAMVCLLAIACLGGARVRNSSQISGAELCEISSIRFEGNATLATNDLRTQLSTRETPGFFNKFLYNSISEKLGRKNEYLNALTLGADIDRMRRYYENRGFSSIRIDTSLAFSPDRQKVDIAIRIQEGYRSIIDTLEYRGVVNVPPTVWEDMASSPKIVKGEPFNLILIEEEVRRVLRILYDNGYPNAVYLRDSSHANRYASNGNYGVLLSFLTGKRYLFGDISVHQETDSLLGITRRDDITDDIILDHMAYKPGDYYSYEKRLTSEKNLHRLGIFYLQRLDVKVPAPTDLSIMVPTLVTIKPRDRNELAPEVIVSDENGALNLGGGLGFTNRNFFGGGRTFSSRIRYQTQTIRKFLESFDNSSSAVANLDLTFELLQPYIFSNLVNGKWSLSVTLDKQIPYQQKIISNRFGVNARFAEFTTGYLEWTLEEVRPDINKDFQGNQSDPTVVAQLNALQKQQFNSILSFTIQRDRTNDIFSPSEGFVHSATFAEAGLLPSLFKGVFSTLPYTQFYKVNLLGRWYNDLTTRKFCIFALKLKAGLEEKYGHSRGDSALVIPQNHRFYGGGSSSVRGWISRDLIAGVDPQFALFGGNLAVEGSMELRTNLLQSLHDGFLDKIWIVQFLDFGNVWQEVGDFRVRQIAIAAGLGFRYDTFFGPFRVDWGFRVYNPAEDPGRQWITQRQLFGQTFKEGVFHFGIGHSF